MTANEFRGVVLGLTDTSEGAHMGHPDFRVNGRVFASLTTDESRATVKLPPEDQTRLIAAARGALVPASGAWGRQGWTAIELNAADAELVGEAATIAWQFTSGIKAGKQRAAIVKGTAVRAGTSGPVVPTRKIRSGAGTRTTGARTTTTGARATTTGAGTTTTGARTRVMGERTKTIAARPKATRAAARGEAPASAPSKSKASTPDSAAVDAYFERCAPEVRSILARIRGVIRREAPEATERISYQMPAFFLNGALIYYAPFKQHIGMYPPVKGGASLQKELAKYRGEKGNLRFPLDEPMPYALIQRVVQARLAEQSAYQASKQRKVAKGAAPAAPRKKAGGRA